MKIPKLPKLPQLYLTRTDSWGYVGVLVLGISTSAWLSLGFFHAFSMFVACGCAGVFYSTRMVLAARVVSRNTCALKKAVEDEDWDTVDSLVECQPASIVKMMRNRDLAVMSILLAMVFNKLTGYLLGC